MTDEMKSRTGETSLAPSSEAPEAEPLTLWHVKNRVRAADLGPQEKADLISALHAVGKTEARDTDTSKDEALKRIIIDARGLLPRLHRRVGMRLGYERQSWTNIGWRVRRALKISGAWALFSARDAVLTAAWRHVVEAGPKLSYLKLLGHWGTLNHVSPPELRDEHVPQFLAWLKTWKASDYARRCWFAAISDWNAGARTCPDWPGKAVFIDRDKREHYSIALDRWSPELRTDVERLMARFAEPDVDYDDGAEAAEELTVKYYRQRLWRTLSAYALAKKLEPSQVTCVAEVLDPPNAKLALDFTTQWIRRRKPEARKTSEVHGSAKLLAKIAARFYIGIIPGESILELQRMARNRCPKHGGIHPRTRRIHELCDDEAFLARFLHWPYQLAAKLLTKQKLRRLDAVRFMLAFACAQAIEAPLRPSNQQALVIGEHISRVRRGGRELLVIRVPAGEVKNDVDLDFELSGPIVELYDAYITHSRPLLLWDPDNRFLYPGVHGEKRNNSLSEQIAKITESQILGERLTGQMFRHIVGYLYLQAHPGEYEVVRQLLGHKNIATTLKFYAQLNMREAGKKVGAHLAKLRAELAPLVKRKRKSD